jgi:hypothetical protein
LSLEDSLDFRDLLNKRRGEKVKMKHSISWKVRLMLLIAFCAIGRSAQADVFKGEIADSQCALNVHSLSRSHKEMLKSKNAGSTSADCARYCVKNLGGAFVLQMKDKVYRLDKQELAEQNAGQKVKLTGTLDPKTNTIHVLSIEPVQ